MHVVLQAVAADIVSADPFAETIVGRIVIPLIGSVLLAAVLGGIAWARYVTKTLIMASSAASDNAREARELAQSVKELVSSTQQLAINGAVTADALSRHLNRHPEG